MTTMHTPEQPDQNEVSPPFTVRDGSPHPQLPAPPRPSADAGMTAQAILPTDDSGIIPEQREIDVFTLTPIAALRMLTASIEDLIDITGDVPPTPPVSHPSTPRAIDGMAKENKRVARNTGESLISDSYGPCDTKEDVDGVPVTKTPIGSPEAGPTEPFHVVGSNAEPFYVQHSALARKFYSKKSPSISLEEYLLRLHRYCPMSTAVYLATSIYIHRLAVTERLIPVTVRNTHRLLLAGLRVAMKALEDLSYPHRRFAMVGGVTEPELGRLEVSFCFLTNFELRVTKEMLHTQATIMRDGLKFQGLPSSFTPILPIRKLQHSKAPAVQEIPRELSASVAG